MSNALEDLLRKAELQKLQIELNIRFQNNLSLFKKRFPNAYNKVKDHKPSRFILQLDPNSNLNLADNVDRVYMYTESPNEYGKKLIQAFKLNPQLNRFRVIKNKEQNPKHLHIKQLNTLIDTFNENKVDRINHAPKYLSNLIVSGIGLGHHLIEAVRSFDIQNILIYEHSLDSLHASMHVLDWAEITNHFDGDNKSISLCVGETPLKALEQIERAIHNIGLHSQIFTFVLTHGTRDTEKEFIDLYMNEIRSFVGGLGYFDDERIGLAHAYHNLKSKSSVFVTPKTYNRKTRALVIGNGPSLDIHEDYLKENHENTILVSCGTALTTLIRMGIKPDFHVEMERPSFIEEVLNYGTTQEQRKGITLLCLHTVSPKTIQCFEDACYAIKPNDAGTSLVQDLCKNTKTPELPFSNPTVTNCALAFLVCMGFTEVHLVGVDLGSKTDKEHHSSKSVYFDFEKYNKNKKNNIKTGTVATLEREGNFGGVVGTTSVLDISRVSIERLLSYVLSVFPRFRCYNSNNGALIKHTISARIEDIPAPKSCNKDTVIKSIKSDHFYQPDAAHLDSEFLSTYLDEFFSIENEVKLSKNIKTDKDLLTEATRAYLKINKQKNVLTHYLLRGTLNCVLGAIIENCLYCQHPDDFKKRVDIGVKHYNRLIENIFARMHDNPDEIDDSISKTLNTMIKDGWTGKKDHKIDQPAEVPS